MIKKFLYSPKNEFKYFFIWNIPELPYGILWRLKVCVVCVCTCLLWCVDSKCISLVKEGYVPLLIPLLKLEETEEVFFNVCMCTCTQHDVTRIIYRVSCLYSWVASSITQHWVLSGTFPCLVMQSYAVLHVYTRTMVHLASVITLFVQPSSSQKCFPSASLMPLFTAWRYPLWPMSTSSP